MLRMFFSVDLLFDFVELHPYSRCLVVLGSHRVVVRHVLVEVSATFTGKPAYKIRNNRLLGWIHAQTSALILE